ncbi:12820_t:CDS:2 [Gigaspora margarita]|uniref:12820_t:CDS:1 n=1 Tax=Gigaspora margarita TaxID=4874 RepID=A0ABN7UAF4_GIGMA|nr:12820_t:CDS:2 [Gigaspora margarita]
MPKQLRNLFATLLVFGDVADVRQLWNENLDAIAEDFIHRGTPEGQHQIQTVLQNLNVFLQRHMKTVNDYDLLELLSEINMAELPRTILEELSYHVTQEDLTKENTLNEVQCAIFDKVLDLINSDAEIATGDHQDTRVFILRIPLLPSEEAGLPFILNQKQFPI